MLVAAFAAPSLETLAHARSDFEARLREPYNHHVACMMMGAGNTAYFPVGVADRRYLLQVIQGQDHLLYQSLERGQVRTRWSLALVPRRGRRAQSGALRRMLWSNGYEVATRRLTTFQRAALDVRKPFAFYSAYGPDAWVEAGLLSADGTEGDWNAYYGYPSKRPEGRPLFFPIVAEEAAALGLPAERWHGPGPLVFAHVRKGQDSAEAPVQRVP